MPPGMNESSRPSLRSGELNPAHLPDAYSYLLAVPTSRPAIPRSAREIPEASSQQNPNRFRIELEPGRPAEARPRLRPCAKAAGSRPTVPSGDLRARFHWAPVNLEDGKLDAARNGLESDVKQAPAFVEAHISLATAYYRLQRKSDGGTARKAGAKVGPGAAIRYGKG